MNITLNQSNLLSNDYQIWRYAIISFSLWGILTNILVFILCLKNVRQHSYMWFIANLALADFVTCVQAFILFQSNFIIDNFDNFACKLIPAIAVVSVGAALNSQPRLAFNRYVATVRPDWYKRIFENPFIIALLLLSSWLLPTIFSIYDFYAGCLDPDLDAKYGFACFFNPNPTQKGCLLPKMIEFIIYFILSFCYFKILWALRRHQRQLIGSGMHSSELARDQQLLRLIALHALAPICVSMPGFITFILSPNIRYRYRLFDRIVLLCVILNTILDPLLTLFIVKIFRNSIVVRIERIIYFITHCRSDINLPVELNLLDNLAHNYRRHSEERREKTV